MTGSESQQEYQTKEDNGQKNGKVAMYEVRKKDASSFSTPVTFNVHCPAMRGWVKRNIKAICMWPSNHVPSISYKSDVRYDLQVTAVVWAYEHS